MSPEKTIEKMKRMRLSAMAEAYEHQLCDSGAFYNMSFDERLAMLIDYEADVRATNKVARLVKGSGMYFIDAAPERIRFGESRGFTKDTIARILDCSFIKKKQNVIVEGPSASGKTWLSCAIGMAACREGYKVRYQKMRSLIDELLVARAALDGTYQKMVTQLKKTPLLIIDDFLLHEVSSEDMGELLELVDARLLCGSTVLCSQYRHEGWMEIMGRTPISEAFMSRMRASSHIICLTSTNDLRISSSDLA